ncbi:hypothetical protein N7492_002896 [Penicillium capsulatum]|uniref:Fungal specific transcription factor n=1 Tax=Penicillium capsulatum TaxID=69766 RepID=A0A9W9IQ04_9EURO|nr:hypothetical protein N7492_002896 [Penicillium capsulatum]KAJ6122511.1 hypothetical protein N7512_004976 [Penicillium capsulatum]
MQLSRTAYRAALLHLSVNPVLSRASISTGSLHPLSQLPQTSSSRLYSVLFPQCAPQRNIEQLRHAHTMSNIQPVGSTKTESNEAQSQEQSTTQSAEQEHLYLPPSESSGADASQQAPLRLDLSEEGSAVKLDHLGPMVVNVDGSLARIGNWEQMTEIERKNTLRILGKRNKQRLEALRAAKDEKTD